MTYNHHAFYNLIKKSISKIANNKYPYYIEDRHLSLEHVIYLPIINVDYLFQSFNLHNFDINSYVYKA